VLLQASMAQIIQLSKFMNLVCRNQPHIEDYTNMKGECIHTLLFINLLTPNVNYSGRIAPLTSKVAFYIFIQQI